MTTIELPPHCDRPAAAALHSEFVEKVSDSPLQVDASKVERLGLAMLDLLVSADRTGGGITLINPSTRVCDALSIAGLESLLPEKDNA